MPVSSYDQLIREIIASASSHNYNISSLKKVFENVINSPRTFERITKLKELLKVLKLRGSLSEDNVDDLIKIAQRLSNKEELMNKISEYKNSHIPRCFNNQYASPTNHINKASQASQTYANILPSPLCASLSPRKFQRIYDTITEEIGAHWKQLGRNLNIQEHYINTIDHDRSSTSCNQKAEQIMDKFFTSKADQRWFFMLCEALDNSDRGDLRRILQEIMTNMS